MSSNILHRKNQRISLPPSLGPSHKSGSAPRNNLGGSSTRDETRPWHGLASVFLVLIQCWRWHLYLRNVLSTGLDRQGFLSLSLCLSLFTSLVINVISPVGVACSVQVTQKRHYSPSRKQKRRKREGKGKKTQNKHGECSRRDVPLVSTFLYVSPFINNKVYIHSRDSADTGPVLPLFDNVQPPLLAALPCLGKTTRGKNRNPTRKKKGRGKKGKDRKHSKISWSPAAMREEELYCTVNRHAWQVSLRSSHVSRCLLEHVEVVPLPTRYILPSTAGNEKHMFLLFNRQHVICSLAVSISGPGPSGVPVWPPAPRLSRLAGDVHQRIKPKSTQVGKYVSPLSSLENASS